MRNAYIHTTRMMMSVFTLRFMCVRSICGGCCSVHCVRFVCAYVCIMCDLYLCHHNDFHTQTIFHDMNAR